LKLNALVRLRLTLNLIAPWFRSRKAAPALSVLIFTAVSTACVTACLEKGTADMNAEDKLLSDIARYRDEQAVCAFKRGVNVGIAMGIIIGLAVAWYIDTWFSTL
jgi:hypothetical protein